MTVKSPWSSPASQPRCLRVSAETIEAAGLTGELRAILGP